MGTSPQESAAEQTRARVKDYMASLNYNKEFQTNIEPHINKGIDIIENEAIPSYLKAVSANLGSLRGSGGSALVESGAAPGAPTNSAFLGALAPAIAQVYQGVSGLQTKIAGLETGKADILSMLMQNERATVASLFGAENQAVGGMKSSTLAGDIFGGIKTVLDFAGGIGALGAGFGLFDYEPPVDTRTTNQTKA